MPFDYFAFGFRIRSDWELPELAGPAGAADLPLVRVCRGSVGTIASPRYEDAACSVGDDDYILNVPGVARYRVRHGEDMIIESIAGGDPERLRMFLVGTALSVLCLQRGLLPLHAGTIEAGRRAIAFAGGSGAGKSTLCAHFENGGYNILSDDVCMIDVRRDHSVVWPGLPHMRLRRDAAALLERNLVDAVRQDDGAEKFLFTTRARSRLQPLPLDRIYVLKTATAAAPRAIEPLSGAQALEVLLSNTYRGFLLGPMGRASQHFVQCLRLLRHVEVFGVRRRWGRQHFMDEAARLEGHFGAAAFPHRSGVTAAE